MPQLDDTTQQYLRDAEQGVRRKTTGAWESFTNFALRDNVLEIAVGLMCAYSPLRIQFLLLTRKLDSQQHSPPAPTPL